MKIRPLIILAALLAAACAPQAEPFWLGADISGSEGQQARGEYYYDAAGNGPKEITSLMKEMGLKAYRFSIAWTRIFPEGNGQVNEKGVAFYNDLIDELIKADITPIVTIYHFDYPLGLVKQYGGWLDRRSIDDYVNYAEFLFKTYGDRVKYWLTINEQDHVVHMPFRLGFECEDRKEAEKLG